MNRFKMQQLLSLRYGSKIDMYYKEGKGTLYVLSGQPLTPGNVIFALPDWRG